MTTRTIGDVLEAHPDAAAALVLLNQAAEELSRASRACTDCTSWDDLVIDVLLAARRLHVRLASLTVSDDLTPRRTTPLPN